MYSKVSVSKYHQDYKHSKKVFPLQVIIFILDCFDDVIVFKKMKY